MEELIKLDAYPIRGLVGRLLQDKTTRKNILFASDSYAGYGAGYRDDSQMTEGLLLGFDSCDIQPRVYKAAAEQTERTHKRAEVFTPAWIVNQMNNHCDAEWFGRADVFNYQEGQEWTVSTDPVTFPEGKDWKQYVDSRRLEITCGEAPYIVSRYDTSTGEIIPIEQRIGILDRKLRIVNENAADEAEWFKWSFRAFQSVYGYEYQGGQPADRPHKSAVYAGGLYRSQMAQAGDTEGAGEVPECDLLELLADGRHERYAALWYPER